MELSVENLTMAINQEEVFFPISFSLSRGQTLLIKGDSGCGKSSLLKCLFGLMPRRTGSVTLDGRDTGSVPPREIRKAMAYLPQNCEPGKEDAGEFINQIHSFAMNKETRSHGRALELLDYFSLPRDIILQPLNTLSGGEYQRILLVAALSLERQIYLLDEVTSSLDKEMKKKVVSLVSTMKESSALVVSHDSQWQRKNIKVIELEKSNGANT